MHKINLILASESPQRIKILKDLGISFKAVPARIDEHHDGLTKPSAIVKAIALRKAEKVAKTFKDKWVLGCDTIVILRNGEIALKPKDKEDAIRTIKLYRNSKCAVYSGLALFNIKERTKLVSYEKSVIHFRDFKDDEIDDYIKTGDWRNRSGSMTIEGVDKWIKKIEGCYWNIVGLPVDLLKKFLMKI